MGKLSEATPKALLEVAGKTLLEYKLDALPPEVDEVIIVVGYMGGAIQRYLGGEYNGKRILYVIQEKQNGTAGALWAARPNLRDSFLVMSADDIYAKEDIENAVKAKPWAVLGLKVNSLGSAAKIITNKRGRVTDILESEARDAGAGFVNTGLYHLDMKVFDARTVSKSPGSGEIGLPQTLVKASSPLYLQPATFWLQITAPEDLKKAEEIIGNRP